jgi:NAD(P)-dependent dehydrogenase (short-subunit alcohol dehydrogenase family)
MTPNPRPLALVTGAAHRLGRSFALTLARMGYDIILHYNGSASAARSTQAEIEAMGVNVFPAQADLTDPSSIRFLFSNLQLSTFNLLVNSASIMPRADITTLSVEDWDSTFDLNVRAPFLLAQFAAQKMTNGGLIVNITDVAAQKAWTGFPAYTVSKAALESLTKVLARSLAPQIRVNALAPGLVLRADDLPLEQWERLVNKTPLQRPVDLDHIAGALKFLIENESITGQTITIDGGYSLV